MPIVNVPADHATITAALAAITDASADNIYTIQVAPGTYDEDGAFGYCLDLKDFVDIQGADRDSVIIRSNGGGTDKDAIWAVAKCTVSSCTLAAQASDHYAVHIDTLCDWFSMNHVVIRHDEPAKPAIAAGGRAGQVIHLTDVSISQGTFSIHSDVYSRGASGEIWEWSLLRVSAPSLDLIDFVEYKDNRVRLQACDIAAITYARDLTYYNLYPEDPLFNQGYVRPGMRLVDCGGNSVGSLTGIGLEPEGTSLSGQKILAAAGYPERLHVGLAVNGPVMVRALPSNSGLMHIGDQGGVTGGEGMPLSAGESVVLHHLSDLRNLWLDTAADGEGVAWILLSP